MSDATTTIQQPPPRPNTIPMPAPPTVPGPARPANHYDDWKDAAFTAMGWRSAVEKQTADYIEMSGRAAEIQAKAMTPLEPGEAAALRKGSGDTFKSFQDLRAQYEPRGNRTKELGDSLQIAADAYITRFNGQDQRYRRDKNNIRKRDFCLATTNDLKQLAFLPDVKKVPPPQWDSQQAGAAAELKVKLDLASLPPGKQQAQYFNSGTASPTFWINKSSHNGQAAKTFIFKPATNSPPNGFPPNGEPAREAVAGKVATLLNESFGMKLPVPNTQVISLKKDDLPKEGIKTLVDAKKIDNKETYVGSVQEFEATDGSFAAQCSQADRANLDQRSVHELAVFDLLTLNTDRHEGNFLIRKQVKGPDQLVPIDHGNCFPDKNALFEKEAKAGTESAALMNVPAAHMKFSREMRAMITKLDPAALEVSLKRERDTLKLKDNTIGSALSDEAIAQSGRSAMFLKRAAPSLCPAAIQFAIKQYGEKLFNAPDNQFAQIADGVIQSVDAEQEFIKEWFLMPADMQKMVNDQALKLGWADVASNGPLTLKLLKTRRPNAVQKPKLKADAADGALTQQETAKLVAMAKEFPNTANLPKPGAQPTPQSNMAVRKLFDLYDEWAALQGTADKVDEYRQLCGKKPEARTQLTYTNLFQALNSVKMLSELRTAAAAPRPDEKIVEIKLSLEFIETILPALPDGDRASAIRDVASVKAALDPGAAPLADAEKAKLAQAAAKLQTGLANSACTYQLGVIRDMSTDFEARIAGTLDGDQRSFVRKTFDDCNKFVCGYQFTDAVANIQIQRTDLRKFG